jgi:hypothetical protein
MTSDDFFDDIDPVAEPSPAEDDDDLLLPRAPLDEERLADELDDDDPYLSETA